MIRLVAMALVTAVAIPLSAAPLRVASLDLCADELALRLAAPGQLISVSWLGADPAETTLSARAAGLARNRGRLSDVAGLAPDLILTSNGIGGDIAATLARRLGTRIVAIPPASTVSGVRANIRLIAAALERPAAGEAEVARFNTALGLVPGRPVSAVMIGASGSTPRADGLAADYLRYAGLRLTGGGSVRLEKLLATPPAVVVQTRYHPGETSIGASWLRHPLWQRLPPKTQRLTSDGRPWTCLGPETADTIAALRRSRSVALRGSFSRSMRVRG